jgi:hypothetical protein
MRIPAFAKLYEWYSQAVAWLKGTEAWRYLDSVVESVREFIKATSALVAQWTERRRDSQASRRLN